MKKWSRKEFNAYFIGQVCGTVSTLLGLIISYVLTKVF